MMTKLLILHMQSIILYASILGECLGLQGFQSRGDFLSDLSSLLSAFILGQKTISRPKQLSIPLIFLPKAGCLALQISLAEGAYEYYAVIDTGSPFLTAPTEALYYSCDVSQKFPSTAEQYGESIGEMQWRESTVSLYNNEKNNYRTSGRKSIVLGVPPKQVMNDTGGLFCGLLAQDDARPTFLEQFGGGGGGGAYFGLDWQRCTLALSEDLSLRNDDRNTIFGMYDLSPYGPNLHHYAVECAHVVFQTDRGPLPVSAADLSRPVVVVLDSGLSGCILSDSWLTEDNFFSSRKELEERVHGATIRIGDGLSNQALSISSQPNYWYLSCFRLPWFADEANHPHIIAAGATFLNGSKLSVNAKDRQFTLVAPAV